MARERIRQSVLLVGLIGSSWLAMMLVHECGHMLGAIITGGGVKQLVWHPFVFSRTEIDPNPQPLLVVWSGPVVGIAVPIIAASLMAYLKSSVAYLMTFFAGFCLVANGAYIGIGVADRIGDAGDMLRLGTPMWLMLAFGVATIPAGFCLWHLSSVGLGFGRPHRPVNRRHAYGMLAGTVLFVLVGLLVGNRGAT